MKIEIGESLILSYLKHIKKCQVVQMNWKISPEWSFENEYLISKIMDISNELFSSKYGYDIFKKNSLKQFIAQSEIDAIGISFKGSGVNICAVDIAFHEYGLNYGSREETVTRIVKKCVRTAMVILGSFNVNFGEIIFASPKINNAVYNDVVETINDINMLFQKIGLKFKVKVVANYDFNNEILAPVTGVASNVADTSELFLRSVQLLSLFDKKEKVQKSIVNTVNNKKDNTTQLTNEFDDEYKNLKVAEIARKVLVPILESGKISPEVITLMQEKEYSKKHFDLQYPLLTKVSLHNTKPLRYLAKPIVKIYGEEYYLCSEWFEKEGANNDRPFLLKWIYNNK